MKGDLGISVFADAAAYDAWFETPAGRYAGALEDELLLRVTGDLAGLRLLDVGCGTGRHLALFAANGARGFGLEPSPAMLARARHRLAGLTVPLVHGRAERLPFADGAFDVVTMITSLELMGDPRRALAEARRVCRRRLVVAVLNAWAISGAVRRIKRNLRPTLFRAVKFYSPIALRRALRRLGPTTLSLRATLFFFPVYCDAARGLFAALDRWLTGRGCLGGAFLVAVAGFEQGKPVR